MKKGIILFFCFPIFALAGYEPGPIQKTNQEIHQIREPLYRDLLTLNPSDPNFQKDWNEKIGKIREVYSSIEDRAKNYTEDDWDNINYLPYQQEPERNFFYKTHLFLNFPGTWTAIALAHRFKTSTDLTFDSRFHRN